MLVAILGIRLSIAQGEDRNPLTLLDRGADGAICGTEIVLINVVHNNKSKKD